GLGARRRVGASDVAQHPHDLVERVVPVRLEAAFQRLADGPGPRSEALGRQVADPLDLVHGAEVREQDDRTSRPLADALDRGDRELEVVVRGRRGGTEATGSEPVYAVA